MSNISKFTSALLSLPVELTVAGANLNFDFSLIKVTPPQEFHGLRDVLSPHRRVQAEDGQAHTTARKLGALFESILPPIPNLIKAYGIRVSEISHSAASKHKQPNVDMFAEHAGFDGTSIWAAATSGEAALAIHLLACMLARIWKSHESISIWVELVERRKQQILDEFQATNASNVAAIMASKQAFNRQQLASWDSSARAWLQTADHDRRLQQTQLMLVIDNVQLPVNSNEDVYESVVEAWTLGMITMERLAQGLPQQIQNGSVLLAMSAWHLYPDMEVLAKENTPIKQHDEVMKGAAVTIPLQGVLSGRQGVFWSLSLARMRYYTPPMVSERLVSSETSLIPIDDFWILVLGAVISQWSTSPDDVDICCNLIIAMRDMVRKASETLPWLELLADAAKAYLAADGPLKKQHMRLFRLGFKRCQSFLNAPNQNPLPVFGLLDIEILLSMMDDDDTRLACIRKISHVRNLPGTSVLIRYPEPRARDDRHMLFGQYRYASTLPYLESMSMLRRDSEPRMKRARHDDTIKPFRWIVSRDNWDTDMTCDGAICGCVNANGPECPCDRCSSSCHASSFHCSTKFPILSGPCESGCKMEGQCSWCTLRHLQRQVEDLGEQCVFIQADDVRTSTEGENSFFVNDGEESVFEFALGDVRNVAIYTQPINRQNMATNHGRTGQNQATLKEMLMILQFLSSRPVARHLISWWQDSPANAEQGSSLMALAFASNVYKHLGNTGVNVETINTSLFRANWVRWVWSNANPSPAEESEPGTVEESIDSTAASLACIAALQSGYCDVYLPSLKGVIALSMGDSIFVSSVLISDPAETGQTPVVRRVFGNLGRPDIAFLVPPACPRMKEFDVNSWRLVNHLPFNGELGDMFRGTSLHLSFTDFELPIDLGHRGLRDNLVVLVESLVSINDKGRPMGDIDVLALTQSPLIRVISECQHRNEAAEEGRSRRTEPICDGLISIDSWEDFLDFPDSAGIVRARGNWQARMALAAASASQGRRVLILPPDLCLKCVETGMGSNTFDVFIA